MPDASTIEPATPGHDGFALDPVVRVAASRGRALARGTLWAALTLVLGAITFLVLRRIDFQPSAVTGRLVNFSIAAAGLIPAFATLLGLAKALQWLSFALWPAPVGVVARRDAMTLRLAWFGGGRYPAAEMDIRYPFELSPEETEDEFDAFLPEDQQRQRLLPRIVHPSQAVPLNRLLLRFVALPEGDLAARLRPVIDLWRGERSSPSED